MRKHLQIKLLMPLLFFLLLITSACDDGDSNTSSSNQPHKANLSVQDPLDTKSGIDITKVEIISEEDNLRLTLSCSAPLTSIPSDLLIYLYGANRDRISFISERYELWRGNNADGDFEEKITEGFIENPDSASISFVIDQSFFSDIYLKQIWLYSVNNQERVPDLGTLDLGIYPEAALDIYNFPDDEDSLTLDNLLT